MTESVQTREVISATGRLDRIISELILLSKARLDEADWQTMKHHAEDMEAAAKVIIHRYEGRPQ